MYLWYCNPLDLPTNETIFIRNPFSTTSHVTTIGVQPVKSVMTIRGIIPAVVEMNYLSAMIWCVDNYKDNKDVCMKVLYALASCPAVRAQMIASKCVETVFAMEPLFVDEHTFPVLACQMFTSLDEDAMIKERLGGAGIFDFLLAVLNHIENAEATCVAMRLLCEQSEAVEGTTRRRQPPKCVTCCVRSSCARTTRTR